MLKRSLPFAISFSIAFVIFSIWLLAQWPGFLNYDTFVNWENASKDIFDDWPSYLYMVYLNLLMRVLPSIGYLGLFHIFWVSLGAASCFHFFWREGAPRWLLVVCFANFVIAPINPVMNIYYTRDSPFSWLHSGLAIAIGFLFYIQSKNKRSIGAAGLVLIAVATAVLLRLRSDAILLLALVPLFVFCIFRVDRRQATIFLSGLLASLLLVFVGLPRALGVEKPGPIYTLTALLNPLAFIVSQDYRSDDKDEDRKVINKVIDFQRLINERSDYEIPAFHNGAVKVFSEQEWSDFKPLVFRIFATNPGLFLENRWRMFEALIGLHDCIYFTDDLNARYPFAEQMAKKFGIKKEPWSSSLFDLTYQATFKLMAENPQRIFFATMIFPLMIIFASLVFFRRFPASAMAAAIIFCRLPVVFLFAPAPQFRYIYGFYLSMFFLIPLMALEWQRSREA